MKLFTIGDSISQGFMSGAAAFTNSGYSTIIFNRFGATVYHYTFLERGQLINITNGFRKLQQRLGKDISELFEWPIVLNLVNSKYECYFQTNYIVSKLSKKLEIKLYLLLVIPLMIYLSSCGNLPKQTTKTTHDHDSVAQVEVIKKADSIAAAIMPHFPWPPPQASAFVKLPRNLIVKGNQTIVLSEAALTLENALNNVGYAKLSYYYFPYGFALVSQIEQINQDGTPKKDPLRWSLKLENPNVFSLESYMKALFTSNPGHFRVIAFVITSKPFRTSKNPITDSYAKSLVDTGLISLPREIFNREFSSEYFCTALIYEFKQRSVNDKPVFLNPSGINGKAHLVNSKIWEELSK